MQLTASLPGGSIRRVLLLVCAGLLATGLAGAALVGDDQGGTARSNGLRSAVVSGSGASTVNGPAAAAAPQPATAPPPPVPASGGTTGTAATDPFWGVLLASFPDTPAGTDAANVALTAARASDPQAAMVRSASYSSLRRGFVAVVSAHLASRDAALTQARRLQQAGFPDANARCITNGPPCP
ncbi:MAG: hypothetical protein E6G27_11745 [Actinobacteria bacterium]|nr:MAG: hypothetical protein E6G27_11745 [Actinomycetota bacterium]